MLCVSLSTRNSRPIPNLHRCQGKKEEEGIVKSNKSKIKPVSSRRCQHQVGAMKPLQPGSSSFGRHLVNAEEHGSQVQQRMNEKDFSNSPSRRPMDEEEDATLGD